MPRPQFSLRCLALLTLVPVLLVLSATRVARADALTAGFAAPPPGPGCTGTSWTAA